MSGPGPAEGVPIDELLAHRDWVRALARSLYLDRNRADDVEQETWRMALERPPRHAKSLRAWFGRVVRNAAVSAGRKERVRGAREAQAPPRMPSSSPEDAVAAAELQTKLAREVLDLEEPYRTTVVLRWFEGLEASEIAERLGVPVETVRTRLKRAVARLRERMDPDLRDDRDAWCLLVFGVRARGLEAGAATGTVAAGVGGGLAMAASAKLVAAGAAVVAAGAGWWMWADGAAPEASKPTVGDASIAASDASAGASKTPLKREPRARAAKVAVADAGAAAAATSSARADAPEIPLGPDVVHGRVIDDDTGAAVAKVKVSLVWERVTLKGTEPSAVTGADGGFRIPGAKDGTFGELLLQADGYAQCLVCVPWRKQDAKLAKNDAGDVRIHRGRRIAGRVLAADGRTPVAGASVRLSTSGGSSSRMWIQFAAERGTTAADGTFALERIPPSHGEFPYTAFVLASGGVGWARLPGDAGSVDTAGVEITLRPVATATVTVRDESGVPQAGAQVVASPRFEPLGPEPRWDVGHEVSIRNDGAIAAHFAANTDARGVARFLLLPTVPEASRYDFLTHAKGGKGWKDGVAVRAGEDAPVEIVVTPPRKRAIAGFVHAADGTPIAGATIKSGYSYTRDHVTGADGRFRIEVDAAAASWGDLAFVQVTADGFARVEQSFKPDAKQDLAEVDVLLRPAAPIEGRLVDQDGRPVAGAMVGTPRDDARVLTDADGRFVFPDTTAGEWRLTVRPPAPADEWEQFAQVTVQGGAKDVVITIARLKPGKARVVVTVVDETGAPLVPTEAWPLPADASGGAIRAMGRTELGKGKVVLERMKPGRWRLWICVPSRIGVVVPFEVAEGQTDVPLRVVVGRPGVLRGRIDVGDSGAPMPSTVMPDLPDLPDDASSFQRAVPHGPDMHGSARVAPDGTFEFPRLMPGRWRVWTSAEGAIGEAFVEVPAGGEGACVVTMTKPAVLSFRLASAPPSGRVSVQIAQGAGALRRMLDTNLKPKVAALHLSLVPGTYRWRVTFPADEGWPVTRLAAVTQEGEVRVAAGETAVVDVAVVPR